MTPDEHQRERMTRWTRAFDTCATDGSGTDHCGAYADNALAEFDKRFPAPSAAAPVEPDQSAMGMAVSSLILDQTAELTSLRQKSRLWDAVRDGKVWIHQTESGAWFAEFGSPDNPAVTDFFLTAEEAVEAAIAAGALT